MRLPGAAARGERIAELARGLAERFEVPATLCRDLDIAARLHEMGRVLARDRRGRRRLATRRTAQDKRFVLVTRALLHRVDGLRDAGDLVRRHLRELGRLGLPEPPAARGRSRCAPASCA